jgi:hypothetical protein
MFWKFFQLDKVFSLSLFKSEVILHNIKRVMLFSVIGSAMLFVLGKKPGLRFFSFYGFILLLLLDLFWGNYGHFNTIDRAVLHKTTANQNVLKQDESLYRSFAQLKIIKEIPMPYNNEEQHLMISKNIFCPNTLVEHRKFDVWGFSVLALKNYNKVLNLVQSASLPDSTNLMNFLNVKYVLWSEELKCRGYELVQKNSFYLYKNKNYLPRAFLVKNHKVLHDEEELLNTLQSLDFDPSETVLLRKDPENFPFPMEIENLLKNSVNISEYKNNMIALAVESSRSQFLVLSETFYPGWKAFLDGKEVLLYEANLAFRAVAVPQGRHKIIFKYEPLSFRIGLYISLATVTVLIFFIILFSRKRSWISLDL